MGRAAQGLEVGVGTEHGVDAAVVGGVVTVGGEGHEDGVEVQGFHA